jgi:hypothetical protein
MCFPRRCSSRHHPEESKVNQEPGLLPSSRLEKKAQAKACLFFHWGFKEHGPSQAGERSLLRWFWSFIGTSGTVAAQTSAAFVVGSLPLCFSPGYLTSLHRRQIESGMSA